MTIRLSGMSSGLDTDALVKELVKAYSKKTDNYKGEQTKLQWKTDIWSGLNKKVKSFYSKLSTYRFSSAYSLKKTTVSDSTKATVTAGNSAVNGTQTLNITSLAKTGYLTGGKLSAKSGAATSGSTTLKELGMTEGTSGKVTLNGSEITLNDTDTVDSVITKFKNAGVNASFDEKNQRIFVSSKQSGAANDFTLAADNGNGANALYALGLSVKSETSDALNAQFKALGARLNGTSSASNTLDVDDDIDDFGVDDDLDDFIEDLDDPVDEEFGNDDVATHPTTTLEDVIKEYNNNASIVKSYAPTARNNVKLAQSYAADTKVRNDLDTKIGGLKGGNGMDSADKALLTDGAGKFVAGDGSVYVKVTKTLDNITDDTGAPTEREVSYYVKAGDEDNENADKYMLKEGDEGSWTLTQFNYNELGQEQEVENSAFGVKTAENYLVDNYKVEEQQVDADGNLVTDTDGNPVMVNKGLTAADIASYRNANTTIKNFEAAVAAEQEAGTFAGGEESLQGYSLASLKSQLDANIDTDMSGYASDIDIISNTASTYLSDNAFLSNYAAKYNAATDDDSRAAALQELQARIDYASSAGSAQYNSGASRVDATDAKIYLNGAEFTSSSNNFTINGLTINATGLTMTEEAYQNASDAQKSAAAISITTSTDSQGIYDSIKDLFSEYNSLINELTGYYNAASAKGYDVLTDDEKEAMSETQIEQWNDKIKGALLRNDSVLGSLISGMTSILAGQQKIGDKNYSLASFGIQTLGFSQAEANEYNAYHIYGDEDDDDVSSKDDKLMAMINDNPDAVMEFFQNLSQRMYADLTDKLKATSLSSSMTIYNDKEMAKEYSSWNTTISDWEQKVTDMEDAYYKKFSAMETALSKLESSTSQLSSLFG